MIRPAFFSWMLHVSRRTVPVTRQSRIALLAALCAVAASIAILPGAAQVVTIDTKTGSVTNSTTGHAAAIDRRFAQIEPTHVPLTKSELDTRTRLEILRLLQSEQGFAMRPFPKGHKGLTLVANGKLSPAGEDYISMVTAEGTSAKPGDRVVLTNLKFDHSKIVIDLNGGPDHKHAFLRHIQLGTGQVMNPVAQGDDPDPVGARLSLVFPKGVPILTGADVKALLSPLISFDLKTPIQAFTDTLPPKLKEAILAHHVLVGMSIDMVLYAKGQPQIKSREMEGQMPFEEWIYGTPPKDVEFVRINGNRVIRVEIAKTGETPVIFTKDEVEGLMRTDGMPLETARNDPHTVKEGDVQRDPNTQAPAAPPSLRNPGESLPAEDAKTAREGVMRPVQFPKPKSDDSADGTSQQPASGPATTDGSKGNSPAAGPPASAPPANVPSSDDASKPSPSQPPAASAQPN